MADIHEFLEDIATETLSSLVSTRQETWALGEVFQVRLEAAQRARENFRKAAEERNAEMPERMAYWAAAMDLEASWVKVTSSRFEPKLGDYIYLLSTLHILAPESEEASKENIQRALSMRSSLKKTLEKLREEVIDYARSSNFETSLANVVISTLNMRLDCIEMQEDSGNYVATPAFRFHA